MNQLQSIASEVVQWSALTLLFIIGVGILYIFVIYIIDVTQTKQTIRRNYPVVGRFRYFFEHLGEFFRQYFFAMDREELPFNRAERSWAYRAATAHSQHWMSMPQSLVLLPSGKIERSTPTQPLLLSIYLV